MANQVGCIPQNLLCTPYLTAVNPRGCMLSLSLLCSRLGDTFWRSAGVAGYGVALFESDESTLPLNIYNHLCMCDDEVHDEFALFGCDISCRE